MKATSSEENSKSPDSGQLASQPARQIRPLSQALPFKMLRTREVILQRFRPLLLDRKITEQQWRIIRVLAALGEAEILTLSEWCVIHPASLSRILPKMDAAGLITRRTNVGDRRRVIVTLAQAGREIFENLGPESEAVYETIAADIGAERMQDLYRILDEVFEALTPQGQRKSS